MSAVAYHHARNLHTKAGALAGMRQLISEHAFTSLLDVGAGTGTWLVAALEFGITDVMGVDGVRVDSSRLCVPSELIKICDLSEPLDLGRRFDAASCLEVAEHLPNSAADTLVASICRHADLVFFSAVPPGQGGENHINCQPPEYWQEKFNLCGFACADTMRPKIWSDSKIEPWYRQNMFVASRLPDLAGTELRIRHLIHPDMIEGMDFPHSLQGQRLASIQAGGEHPKWYLAGLKASIAVRLRRRVAGLFQDK